MMVTLTNLQAAFALLSALPWVSAAAVASPAVAARQTLGDYQCRDVHIFLARGNNEPYPGRQGKLVADICNGLDSCDYEDIQYDNPLPAPYCGSVEQGVANGTSQITSYNKRCPNSKLVLSGYSQGGQVIGDILGGGGGRFFQDCLQTDNAGLDPAKAPGNKVSAVLIFGDVRHTANQPYNYLSGSGDQGLFPRPPNQLAAYSKIMRSYCVDSDPICAGGKIVANHLNYFDIYSEEAAKWVQGVLGPEAKSSSSAIKTTASPTRSSTKPAGTSAAPTDGPASSSAVAVTTEDAAASPSPTTPPTLVTAESSNATGSAAATSAARATASYDLLLLLGFSLIGAGSVAIF